MVNLRKLPRMQNKVMGNMNEKLRDMDCQNDKVQQIHFQERQEKEWGRSSSQREYWIKIIPD